MVGSRKPTANGRETARRFARYLSERGLTIVSGLATGIDGASHRGGLQGCGSTVAVLGSGSDVLFPRSHKRLAAEIIDKGLIVSEFPPGTPPLAAHFPQRNRIIAGMSAGTLVVEAARRSGSLITEAVSGNYGAIFANAGLHPQPHGRGVSPPIQQGAKRVEDAASCWWYFRRCCNLPSRRGAGGEHASLMLAAEPVAWPRAGYRGLLAARLSDPANLRSARLAGLDGGKTFIHAPALEMEGLVEALPADVTLACQQRTPERNRSLTCSVAFIDVG